MSGGRDSAVTYARPAAAGGDRYAWVVLGLLCVVYVLNFAFYTLVPFYVLAIALHFALARALKRDHPKARS